MQKKDLKDHKQIGQEQSLFFTNEISPGSVFWLPNGMIIFKELEKYIRELTLSAGYLETSTPIMVKSEIFKQSGHWEKFGQDNMYSFDLSDDENDQPKSYTLKPMNCPESTILYRFRPRSYRELPLRFSEIGRLHRREKSGEVNGLLRVRQLTMDDAHIYCTQNQVMDEISSILDMQTSFYEKFDFDVEFRLATIPEKFAGTKEGWERAEKELESVLKSKKLKYEIKSEDGAFYGPKIDVHIKDSLGRDWQLATVQLDFHMPEAFDLKYTDDEGQDQKPVMIHRAILGSFERFIGILTEHYQGKFPLWLSPTQVEVMTVSDKFNDYAKKVYEALLSEGFRVKLNDSNNTLGNKIREATLQKVPYQCIIGGQEEKRSKDKGEMYVTVRTRSGDDKGMISLEDLISGVKKEIEKKEKTI